jgi:hypothetical protein
MEKELREKTVNFLKSLKNANNPWVQLAIFLIDNTEEVDPIGTLCDIIDSLIDIIELTKKQVVDQADEVSTTPCAHEWLFIADITTGGEKHYAKCKKCGLIRYNLFTL